jgi:hypothetical protein
MIFEVDPRLSRHKDGIFELILAEFWERPWWIESTEFVVELFKKFLETTIFKAVIIKNLKIELLNLEFLW